MKSLYVTLIILLSATVVHAKIATVGKGDAINFDPSRIPGNLKPAFEIMKVKCIQCHTMKRTVEAISTGIAPLTGFPFDKQSVKAYGAKMLRKEKSNMTRSDVMKVMPLMDYLLDEAEKP
jgi:hypothetical protein